MFKAWKWMFNGEYKAQLRVLFVFLVAFVILVGLGPVRHRRDAEAIFINEATFIAYIAIVVAYAAFAIKKSSDGNGPYDGVGLAPISDGGLAFLMALMVATFLFLVYMIYADGKTQNLNMFLPTLFLDNMIATFRRRKYRLVILPDPSGGGRVK